MLLKLSYVTLEGNSWLESEVSVETEAEAMEACKSYVSENSEAARRLVHRWNVGGEEVDLYPYVECIECNSDNVLEDRLNDYLDFVLEK